MLATLTSSLWGLRLSLLLASDIFAGNFPFGVVIGVELFRGSLCNPFGVGSWVAGKIFCQWIGFGNSLSLSLDAAHAVFNTLVVEERKDNRLEGAESTIPLACIVRLQDLRELFRQCRVIAEVIAILLWSDLEFVYPPDHDSSAFFGVRWYDKRRNKEDYKRE